jgi:tetratricopeptide (TPR) repeat protein
LTAKHYAVSSVDAIRVVPGEAFEIRPVRLHFGVESFGINAYTAPSAGGRVIEEHDELGHGAGRHEELYVVARGHAVFELAGEEVEAPAGTLIFVSDPAVRRGAIAKEDATTVLVVGGVVGQPFQPSPWETWLAAFPFIEAGEPERGVELFLAALERNPGNPNVLYNLACFESLAGHRDEALDHLTEAVEGDPRTREWAQTDSDFDSIRDDARFPKPE